MGAFPVLRMPRRISYVFAEFLRSCKETNVLWPDASTINTGHEAEFPRRFLLL